MAGSLSTIILEIRLLNLVISDCGEPNTILSCEKTTRESNKQACRTTHCMCTPFIHKATNCIQEKKKRNALSCIILYCLIYYTLLPGLFEIQLSAASWLSYCSPFSFLSFIFFVAFHFFNSLP